MPSGWCVHAQLKDNEVFWQFLSVRRSFFFPKSNNSLSLYLLRDDICFPWWMLSVCNHTHTHTQSLWCTEVHKLNLQLLVNPWCGFGTAEMMLHCSYCTCKHIGICYCMIVCDMHHKASRGEQQTVNRIKLSIWNWAYDFRLFILKWYFWVLYWEPGRSSLNDPSFKGAISKYFTQYTITIICFLVGVLT